QAAIASLEPQLADAQRQLATFAALDSARKGLASENELEAARDQVGEPQKRIAIEKRKPELLETTSQEQSRAAEQNLEQTKAVVRFRQDRIRALNVPAGIDGQLQSLNLELGQWVNSGQELARVAQPGKFKAVLRVPETQAPEVVVGQKVVIDLR